jgi:hypothetical protein
MDCIDMTAGISAIGDGTLPPERCASVAAHVSHCEKCQLLVALRILSWEQEYETPQPPTMIARWRAVALHLSVGKDDADVAQLRTTVREGWTLDDIQERALRRWLESVVTQAHAVAGFDPGFEG